MGPKRSIWQPVLKFGNRYLNSVARSCAKNNKTRLTANRGFREIDSKLTADNNTQMATIADNFSIEMNEIRVIELLSD